MEEDPLITQRLRDNARTALCVRVTDEYCKCSKDNVNTTHVIAFPNRNFKKSKIFQGLLLWMYCRSERDAMVSCMEKWFFDEGFRKAVTEEYLNERSHFRQTGSRINGAGKYF